jgi:uncharacterized membrane protein
VRLLNLLFGAVVVAWPFVLYGLLGRVGLPWIAALLALLAVLRALIARSRLWTAVALGTVVLAGVAALGDQALPLKLYPVLVNAVLLAVFGASLLHPPTAIERLARLAEPELPPSAVRYTRRVTQVWCGFFVLNGSIAAATALWASDALWTLYNGLIAYLLIGLLFAGEWLVRRRVRARERVAAELR